MTDLAEQPTHTSDWLRFEERTTVIGRPRLRAPGEIYDARRLSASETMIVRTDLTADPDATAVLRPDEPFIGDLRDPYADLSTPTGPATPPTNPPKPSPPAPPANETRPRGYQGVRRNPVRDPLPDGTVAVLGVGWTLLVFAVGWVSCWAVAL